MKDKNYLDMAMEIAKEGTCGATLVSADGDTFSYSNKDDQYAYMKCIREHKDKTNGATLYLTHGTASRNSMRIVNSGVNRVVYLEEFGIGVGTALLKCMGVKVEQYN